MITLTMDGRKVEAEEGTTLLEVARRISIPIPTLCYHPDLTPSGSCRLCTVEVIRNGESRLVTACNFPVRGEIDVKTHSEPVLRARRVLVELLMARCPHIKAIQDLATELGVKETRFVTRDEGTACILCGLCIRTCHEIVGADAISFTGRGITRQVGSPFRIDSDTCVACGACEYVCPTGAIRMELETIGKWRTADTGNLRYCRYMRMGLIDFMVCAHGYQCWRCELDQAMEDRFDVHPAFAVKPAQAKEPMDIRGFTFMPGLHYRGHIWAKPLAVLVRLGADDFASSLIAADDIQLPPPGERIEAGLPFVRMISADQEAELLAPMGGTVVRLNPDISHDPSLMEKDPYGRGWLMVLKPEPLEFLSGLLHGKPAKEWFSAEVERFYHWLKGETGEEVLPVNGLAGRLDGIQWEKMIRSFFHVKGRMM